MTSVSADPPLRFGRFEIVPAERLLRVDGQPVSLGARAFDLLLALAQRRQRLVGKQELLDLVWPGVVVEEHNITTQISTLRKLLGPQAIATVPGRGYRFTAAQDDGSTGTPQPSAGFDTAAARVPAPHSTLIGRSEDLVALNGVLQRHRLVTLVGAGGMGKSLLAQHVLLAQASQRPDGVCWIELASLGDADRLPLAIAQAIGAQLGPGDPLKALGQALSGSSLLLALDNAEHLLAAVAQTVGALLRAAPGLQFIVTSQAPLQLAAERVYRVGPLAVPDGPLPTGLAMQFGAVALFVERARDADAHFNLTDAQAPAAIELCRQLDGLPLAIELAAARAPLLGVPQLARSMNERLHLLTRNRDAAAPARQQTLRAALAWSHGWLDERERAVFRRLGVMADGASLPLIQHVVADPEGALDEWAVLDALGTLVDRSLVAVLAHGQTTRYRLLESPRLLALELLRAAGEEDTLRARHAHALCRAFDSAWQERWSGTIGAQAWAEQQLPDASNARDAIAWAQTAGDPATAVTIAATLYMALPRVSYSERRTLADLCEACADRLTDPLLRLRALEVAVRPFFHSDLQRSRALADQALTLARELARAHDDPATDRWLLYKALGHWLYASAVVAQPDVPALRRARHELLSLENPHWPPQRLAWGLEGLRLSRAPLGGDTQPADQLAVTRRWRDMLAAAGEDIARCTGALVDAELVCGHVQAAITLGEQALTALMQTRDDWSRSLLYSNLAMAYLELGDTVRARAHMSALWPLAERWDLLQLCSDLPPLLAALEHRPRAAARLAGFSDAICAARDVVRHPLELAARQRGRSLALQALGQPLFEQLLTEGAALHADEVSRVAFAVEDAD